MDYTKQLIKAITDLTKAVNKNTEAIKDNTKLNELDVNTIESGTPDDLNRWLTYNENLEKHNVINGTDGLGNPVTYVTSGYLKFHPETNPVVENPYKL